MKKPEAVIHADWSLRSAGRWSCLAIWNGRRYYISSPRPVPTAPLDLLEPRPGTTFFGIDVPIGLPLAYAQKIGCRDFKTFLGWLARPEWTIFFNPAAAPEEISLRRPFYPARPGGTRRQQLLDGLGVTHLDDLRRRCEMATENRRAAAPLFWTLGAQQVGKSALSAWRELLMPALQPSDIDAALWPFDGSLAFLIENHAVVIAEAYPAEFMHHLGALPTRWSKRRQADRQRWAGMIIGWAEKHNVILAPELLKNLTNGFGPSAGGENPFDAVVGVIGMLNVILGNRPPGEPAEAEIRAIEGWILGQID